MFNSFIIAQRNGSPHIQLCPSSILVDFQNTQWLNPARTYISTVHSPSIKDSTIDLSVQDVAEMLSALKESPNAVHPLSSPLTPLSISDFEADTSHTYKDHF